MTPPRLSAALLRGGATVAGGTILGRLLQLAAYAALARMLLPGDFGTLSLASLPVNALALLPGLGLGTALLAQKSEPRRLAPTTLTAALLSGAAIACVTLVIGHHVARVQGAAVGELVALLGIALFFQAPGAVACALLDRELRFGARVAADLAGGAAFFVVAVASAALGAGARALALGLIAAAGMQSLVALRAAGIAPTLRLRWRELRGTARLGLLVLATTLLQWLFTSSDVLLIEHRFGRAAVGCYVTAFQLAMVPATLLGVFSARLALPALIRARADGSASDAGFLRATRAVALLAAGAVAVFVVAARPLTELLYGERFAASAPLLPILALHAFARVLGGLAGPALLATGAARTALWFVLAQNLVAIPIAWLVPGEYAACGVALVYTSACALAAMSALLLGARRLAAPTSAVLRAALVPFLCVVGPGAIGAWSGTRAGAWLGLALGLVALAALARRELSAGAPA